MASKHMDIILHKRQHGVAFKRNDVQSRRLEPPGKELQKKRKASAQAVSEASNSSESEGEESEGQVPRIRSLTK